LLAGGVVALTPVAALMFRFNNPDALLTLLMALAAWALMRAVETASARWMALVGPDGGRRRGERPVHSAAFRRHAALDLRRSIMR
jgi:hypothetical protein